MASFLCEMADIIICVKYAPNKTAQEIEFQQEGKILQICAHSLSEEIQYMFPYWPRIKYYRTLSFWLSHFQSDTWFRMNM